jgi:hypothetical protein
VNLVPRPAMLARSPKADAAAGCLWLLRCRITITSPKACEGWGAIRMRVGIVGGSIAGCATGALLHRAGHDVIVFERSESGLVRPGCRDRYADDGVAGHDGARPDRRDPPWWYSSPAGTPDPASARCSASQQKLSNGANFAGRDTLKHLSISSARNRGWVRLL